MVDKSKTIGLADALKETRPTAFHVMVKPIGPICNLNCTYCYYLEKEKLYPDTKSFIMPDEVLEEFIRQHFESHEVPVVTFTWQGGEPTLLGLEYFERAMEIIRKYKGKKRIENVFQTNGTHLTEEWCRFFKKHNFLIGISIDGPREIHDKYRRTKTNKPTFDTVMKGIKMLKRFRVEFNTLTVVNDQNVNRALDVYHFLKKIGSKYLQFIPIVEQYVPDTDSGLTLMSPLYEGEGDITPWSIRGKQYGRFLTKIFDEWVKEDVGKTYVQIFDVTLANWVGAMPGLCVFSETCGEASILEHNGDLYTCDHFVYPEQFLGNIMNEPLVDMVKSVKQKEFGRAKRDSLPKQCFRCPYRFACNGGCPKNRFGVSEDGEPGLNWLCDGYKMFFEHVSPYMDFMAHELKFERPPANVMQWIKQGQPNYK